MLNQVEATPAAINLIKEIQDQYGPVIFHQSGGCCDAVSYTHLTLPTIYSV